MQVAEKRQTAPDLSVEEYRFQKASRRQFLRRSMQAGLISGAGIGQVSRVIAGALKPRVAIVGAGLAGLTAAHYLRKKGLEPIVYESDRRIGGRIKSAHIFDSGQLYTEIGAEFIDSNHSDMFRLVKELGLKKKVMDTYDDKLEGEETFLVRGVSYSLSELIEELSHAYPDIVRDRKKLNNPEEKALFDQQSVAEYIGRLPVSIWVHSLLNAAFLGENGMETSEQSAINFLEAFGTKKSEFSPYGESDERYKIIGGNEQLVRRLAAPVLDSIRFEHRLEAVSEFADGSVHLVFNQGGNYVEHKFDAVILTLPFTILRAIDFAVGVCDEKCTAIQELSYGYNTKLILETSERVWRKAGSQGFMFNEVVHNGWDSSHMQNDNRGTGTYTVFLGGQPAQMASPDNCQNQLKECISVLDSAYPGFEAAYTGNRKVAHWPSNPHVYGSYSCFTIGQVTRFSGWAFKPVGNIHFAGEHCSDDFWGFMNGAAETGRKAAQMVLKKVAR